MNRGERQKFILFAAHHHVFADDGLRRAVALRGKERKLGEEFFRRSVARAVARKLLQVF